MNRQPPFRKQKCIISPNNLPSSGIFSSTSFPSINFVLGSSPGLLLTDTLKLNYNFQVLTTAGAFPNNAPANAASPGTNGVCVSNRVGSQSAIDQVHITTMNSRSIENLLNYNRYLATSLPNANNQFDYLNGFQGQDPTLSTKSVGGCRQTNVPVECSVPLKTGFLTSRQPINLSRRGIHGMQISILLQQNANVLSPFNVITQNTNGSQKENLKSATNASTFAYQLSDVFLSYDILVPNDEIYSAMPSSGSMEFNSINSMVSTLLSSDQTLTMRLGLKNLISATHSTIAAVHLNNITQDGMKLERLATNPTASGPNPAGTPANLNSVRYFKGGTLFPIQAVLDSEDQGNTNPQAQIMKPALNSVTLFENSEHQMMNPQTNTEGLNNSAGFNSQEKGLNINQVADPNSNFILGIATDTGGTGIDYSRESYAVRLQSQLDGRSPYQFYSFFRCRQVLSYNPTEVVVME